jgi:hypothetical protein
LITRLQHCQQLIIEEKGLVFATSDMLMENVFRAFNIEKLTNESFRFVVAQHYQKWLCAKKGTFDAEESISDMLSVYRNLVALKKWDPSSASVAKKPGYVSLATKEQKSIDGLHEKLDFALATNNNNCLKYHTKLLLNKCARRLHNQRSFELPKFDIVQQGRTGRQRKPPFNCNQLGDVPEVGTLHLGSKPFMNLYEL